MKITTAQMHLIANALYRAAADLQTEARECADVHHAYAATCTSEARTVEALAAMFEDHITGELSK